jgi:hypothetical protein
MTNPSATYVILVSEDGGKTERIAGFTGTPAPVRIDGLIRVRRLPMCAADDYHRCGRTVNVAGQTCSKKEAK